MEIHTLKLCSRAKKLVVDFSHNTIVIILYNVSLYKKKESECSGNIELKDF